MITTVALNPSIDRTVVVDHLTTGGLNRVRSSVSVAAGKGLNVAKAVCAFGAQTVCAGFLYEDGAPLFEKCMASLGIVPAMVLCRGAVRVNIKVMDTARGEVTELNEGGTPVSVQNLAALREMVKKCAAQSDFTVLTGSIPPGCPPTIYREMMADAGRFVLDADAKTLREGLKAKPYLIKPNRYELEQLVGHSLPTLQDVKAAAQALVREGVSVVVVSLGSEGALLVTDAQAWFAPALKLEVRSTVGAGDSMVAGLLMAMTENRPLSEALRLGVGAAAARCATPSDAAITRAMAEAMAAKVEVREI